MAYDPNLYNPYNSMQFQPTAQPNWVYNPTATRVNIPQPQPQHPQAAPVTYIVPVKSVLEAKEYKEQQGSEPPLFMLEDDNVFIKKEFDEQGGEKLKAFRFTEIPLNDIMPAEGDYVTKADFDNFANKVMEALNGKRTVEPNAETPAAIQ